MHIMEARMVPFRDYAYDHRSTIYGEVSENFVNLVKECEVHEAYPSGEGLIEHNTHVVDARAILFEKYAYDHRMTGFGEVPGSSGNCSTSSPEESPCTRSSKASKPQRAISVASVSFLPAAGRVDLARLRAPGHRRADLRKVTYDGEPFPVLVKRLGITETGALISADRGERRMWARHQALLLRRVVPTVPAPAVAQAWRGSARQAQLARLLTGCDVEALDNTQARAVGTLAARAATTDIVDAAVVEGALRRRDLVVSSDEHDLQAIASAAGRRLEIDHP